MSQESEEGDLTDVSAFAGHIGAGDEGDLLGGEVELSVIGNETLFSRALFEDGMAAILDLQDAFVGDGGLAVIVEPGSFGKGGQDIQLGQSGGCVLERLEEAL